MASESWDGLPDETWVELQNAIDTPSILDWLRASHEAFGIAMLLGCSILFLAELYASTRRVRMARVAYGAVIVGVLMVFGTGVIHESASLWAPLWHAVYSMLMCSTILTALMVRRRKPVA